MKRCIAIEGDTVLTQENDKIVEVTIPEGHAWLESDNHNFQPGQQPDSLKFGPIPYSEVWGRVIYCVRRKRLFPTIIPYPEHYDFYVPLVDSIPHQRIRFSQYTLNSEMLGQLIINYVDQLPNNMFSYL